MNRDDGRPGLRLYKTLPKPKTQSPTLDNIYAGVMGKSMFERYMGLRLGSPSYLTVSGDMVEPQARPDLLAGLEELVAGLDDFESGVSELPEGARDLTSYVDAFASAAKNCKHEDYEDTMYAKREAKCNDCGAYFKRPRSIFG